MTPELATLWELHALDERLVTLLDALAKHPAERKSLEGRVAAGRMHLDAHLRQLADLQLRRRQREKDIVALQAEEQRFAKQQGLVKTNAEFQALTHEIEGARSRRSDAETDVLVLMDEEQALEVAQPKLEQALREAGAGAATRLAAIDAEETRERAESAAVEAERDMLAARLPPGTRSRYERVRDSRGGRGVVAVTKGACGACYRGLAPQALQEVRKRDHVLICDGCGRLVVYPPDGE